MFMAGWEIETTLPVKERASPVARLAALTDILAA